MSKLNFKISSGLKNIIGRDLISDKYIAIFELVKNSYDAGAEKVTISFLEDENKNPYFVIADDGIGMNYDDIINKWLFVAYSEKKPRYRDESYIDKIQRGYAGAKGVGRFSCDRLGSSLCMLTKKAEEPYAHKIEIDWNDFEEDDTNEFINIPVEYSKEEKLPNKMKNGTVLIISELREDWNRDALLYLKRSLIKLVNPHFDKGAKPFEIKIIAPCEEAKDEKTKNDKEKNKFRDVVNGIVYNDIIEKLNLKTTSIEVNISEDGKEISTKLVDKGKYIFTIVEKNKDFPLLYNIRISIIYLNSIAKAAFTNQMGKVRPKEYGSVFIYKNGFRVMPFGDPGLDFFGIDMRKAQGWKRFLGTREIMGTISILGDNKDFSETTSRAHGFITTPSVMSLEDFFVKKVLSPLEKYVVNLISWGEPLKNRAGHIIEPEEISSEIVAQFFSFLNKKDIIKVDYNEDILLTNNKAPDSIKNKLKQFEKYASESSDPKFKRLASSIKKNTENLLETNLELDIDNKKKEQELNTLTVQHSATKKQVSNLTNALSLDVKALENHMHLIYTIANACMSDLYDFKNMIEPSLLPSDAINLLSEIIEASEKINKISDLSLNGIKVLDQKSNGNLSSFIETYINKNIQETILKLNFYSQPENLICNFTPYSIGIIIDNVISNSIKAKADKLFINLEKNENQVILSFLDNGSGINPELNPQDLFERGYSLNLENKGFGIGLTNIKELVEEMNGTVIIDTKIKSGFKLEVRLPYEY